MKKLKLLFLMLASFTVLVSCQDEFGRLLPDKEYIDAPNVQAKQQKVLYIIVDGARGASVKEINPPNIAALTLKATYSWNSLSDELGNEASSWADMFTGVTKEKHNVYNATFSGSKFDRYPTFITRIKEAKPSTRVSSFAASIAFKEKLAVGADVNMSFATDVAVKNAVVEDLAQENAAMVIAEFGEVNKVGETVGYDASFPAYRNAILQFDGYVGEMVAAVKARRNYANENWLVIVSSSRGGAFAVNPSDGTIFSNALINTFTIYSSINYNLKFIDKPYTGNRYDGNFVRLNGVVDNAIRAQILDSTANKEIFNFGDTTQFTIELKVKKANRGTDLVPNYDYASPAILSKKVSNDVSSGLGWSISLENKGWQIDFGKSGVANQTMKGKDINDGNWHSLAVVVLNRDFHRYVRTFTDGVFNAEAMLPDNWGPIDFPSLSSEYNKLTIGYIPGRITNSFDGFISDVKIWLTPITDARISSYSCDTYVSSGHPNYKRLAGYWPCTDGTGSLFRDNSVTRANFTVLKGDVPFVPTWIFNTSLTCPVASTSLATMVPNTKDNAAQILSWFAIAPSESWKLDGRVWLNQ